MSENVENEVGAQEAKSAKDELSENQEAKGESVEDSAENAKEEQKKDEVDYKSQYFYLAAEMENMRKRHDRERQNFIKFGNEKIVKSLLDVLDNLDRTLGAVTADSDEKVRNICQGVEMVRKQFFDVLSDNGVKEVEAEGQTFDPNFHEALTQQAVEGKKENEIINVFQKGYILNGRLVRAAKVIVAK